MTEIQVAVLLLCIASLLTVVCGVLLIVAAKQFRINRKENNDIQYRVTVHPGTSQQVRHYFGDLQPARDFAHEQGGGLIEERDVSPWRRTA